MLRTKTKLRIARMLNRVIVLPRLLVGKRPIVQVRRRGINWCLDLNEAIDFAIYLGLYQAIPRRVIDEWIHPGCLAIDIGANIGAFALPMLMHVGDGGCVVAVEPTDYAYEKLKTNLELNPRISGRAVAVQSALAASDGALNSNVTFYSRWPLNGNDAHRHVLHEGQAEGAQNARFLTLDNLLGGLRADGRIHGRVSFIKLDADGHELEILQGAARMITSDRPALLVEIAPYVQDEKPQRFEEMLATLIRYGYGLEDAATGRKLPMSAAELRRAIKYGASIDAMARPI